MENLSEHLKENVTYINGLFENAMDYIEREFMVGHGTGRAAHHGRARQ